MSTDRALRQAGLSLWGSNRPALLGEVGGQWTSVVMLRGLHDRAVLAQLDAAGQGLAGVRWVDKPADVIAALG